ncbi:MAG TPA: class I SAM-dependent methyltransferase [Kofleriaceae bacterium]|nr:class I SAM-dependent methyltransferase [Kofleriaceae bacterium]
MTSNDDMIAYWNGDGGRRWIAAQDRLDRAMAAIGEALLAAAAPRPGERALDVGCGLGTMTLALARSTGTTALGVDVSAPMIELAAGKGGDATFVVADAARFAFTPDRDLVFSRFGVMFFADPVAAFVHLRRAFAPGGRLVFACWRAPAENPWAAVPLAAARELLPPQPPPDPIAPGPFAFGDGARVRSILERAGYRDIAIDPHDTTMWLGESPEDAAVHALSVGPLARAAAELPEPTRARIRERVAAAVAPFAGAGGIAPPAAIWLVRARP